MLLSRQISVLWNGAHPRSPKWFPLSFKYSNSVGSLIVGIIVYLIVGILAGLVIGLANILLGWIPVIGAIVALVVRVLAALIDVYVVAGIVIQILAFLKVLKD